MQSFLAKQQGYTMLATTAVLLVLLTLTSLVATRSTITEQKVINNEIRSKQAFEAAEAGLEYGLMYVSQNSSMVVVDADTDGYIDPYTHADITNVAQGDNTQYTVSYSNPIVSDLDVIEVVSAGKSADGTITRTIRQMASLVDSVASPPVAGLMTKGRVDMNGNMTVTNIHSPYTVVAGDAVTLGGSASTDTGSGGSDKSSVEADVLQNDADFNAMSGDQFFQTFFHRDKAGFKSVANHVYTNTSATNYSSSLDGMLGKTIWIEQTSDTATINSNVTIGSPSEPVVIVVSGDLKLAGGATIYGMVYVTGNWDNSGMGTADIYGAAVVEGDFQATGTPNIIYDNDLIDKLPKSSFAKIPGTWRDF